MTQHLWSAIALAAVLVVSTSNGASAQVVVQATGTTSTYAGTPAYTPSPAYGATFEPRTRANPAHIVGLSLGIAGILGGGLIMIGGLLVSAFGGDTGLFLTGGIILGVGLVATIVSAILLGTDRIPVDEPMVSAAFGPDGGSLWLTQRF